MSEFTPLQLAAINKLIEPLNQQISALKLEIEELKRGKLSGKENFPLFSEMVKKDKHTKVNQLNQTENNILNALNTESIQQKKKKKILSSLV